MEKRYFTLDEAQRMLPRIQLGLTKLLELHENISFIKGVDFKYDDSFENLTRNVEINVNFHRLYFHFFQELQRMLELGVIVKDVENGVVDLFAMHQGREIHLCYRSGEDKIRYWHEVDSGFAGRQPVNLLETKKQE